MFFNDTAATEIYTLSLHDALPISAARVVEDPITKVEARPGPHPRIPTPENIYGDRKNTLGVDLASVPEREALDRKSTRLNSSHANISYAVLCLKKKNSSHPSFSDS